MSAFATRQGRRLPRQGRLRGGRQAPLPRLVLLEVFPAARRRRRLLWAFPRTLPGLRPVRERFMNLLLLLAKPLAKLSGDRLSLSMHHSRSGGFCISAAK